MDESLFLNDVPYIPATTREWYEWLCTQQENTIATYKLKPQNLIRDYRNEQGIVRAYKGREILELLQNANDQASGIGLPGRIHIELTPDGLIAANTGLAFSAEGVMSLQTDNLSPKRRRRRKKPLLGNKGLGFRAILNWTKTPIILSSALCLAYSQKHADALLNRMIAESLEIAEQVLLERQGTDALILPLLPFPLFTENGDLSKSLDTEPVQHIFQRCETLLLEDYDTIIGMPFDAESHYDDANSQIDEMHPDILLFVENLSELCFLKHGEPAVIWKREEDGPLSRVLANGEVLREWQVYRKTGELPPDVDQPGQEEAMVFEVVVAVPQDGRPAPGILFSHFPTDIVFPLPIVCHATLELEQNRKHAEQGRPSNRFVIEQLAGFIAEVAEKVAAQADRSPWSGCSLIIPSASYTNDLTREHFPEKLIEAAKQRRILPTLSGKHVCPADARFVPGANSTWLPTELFPEVVPIRDNKDLEILSKLDVDTLDVSEIKKRILAHSDFTMDQRIGLIAGLLAHPNLSVAATSALLLDADGQTLTDGIRVFLTPAAGQMPTLPPWANLRFLNEEMRLSLFQRLKARDNRDLQQKLTSFNVISYSLDEVIRSLGTEATRTEKANPAQAQTIRADLLRTVYQLYTRESGNKVAYPVAITLHVPSQDQKESPANTLYFGSGLSEHGEIIQTLYHGWASGKLVDAGRLSHLTEDRQKLKDFLQWIGVVSWPRDTEETSPAPEYKNHLLNAVRYPARFAEKYVASPDHIRSPDCFKVASVENLDQILKNAPPYAVVLWLANDPRAADWGRNMTKHARLTAYPFDVRAYVRDPRVYDGPLPSYIRWRIETTVWLPSADGNKWRPKDCVCGERSLEELFPRPVMPDEQTLTRCGVQRNDVFEGWRRAGVLNSLADLERDEIYAKLLELPKRSPDGKLARPLYLCLLDARELAAEGDGRNQKDFLEKGLMWGKEGEQQGYYPVSDLYHVDGDGFPQELLQTLKIVSLRKRVGPDRVQKLFGVKPLERAAVHSKLIARTPLEESEKANTYFQKAKPYLHKMRTSQTSEKAHLQALKELYIEVCSTLQAELTFQNQPLAYDLPIWGWLKDDNTLYIRANPEKSFLCPLQCSMTPWERP